MEGTLTVLRKSLKTVLNEVDFIVNLCSFPLSLVLKANPPFRKVNHLPPSQAEQLRKLSPTLDTLTIALVCLLSSNLSHS